MKRVPQHELRNCVDKHGHPKQLGWVWVVNKTPQEREAWERQGEQVSMHHGHNGHHHKARIRRVAAKEVCQLMQHIIRAFETSALSVSLQVRHTSSQSCWKKIYEG